MNFMKSTFLFALLLASGIAFAQQAPPQEQPPQPPPVQQPPAPEQTPEPATTGTKEVPAEVVSADTQAKTITVKVMVKKDAASEPTEQQGTIPVDPDAAPALESVTPGEKVKLLCRMNGAKVIAVKGINKGEPPKSDVPKS